MFGKLREMVGRSLAPTLELDALRTYLGTQYATDYQNFMEGKYQNDESLKKRANGLSFLGKAILKSKQIFNDPERHKFFWEEIAKRTIDVRYGMTFSGQYDPDRFYLDALDYSAIVTYLPAALGGSETPVSHRMIDVFQGLNAREADGGGYFGNTPYWTLHNNQIWRMIDRNFTSVQMYWFALLLVDEASSTLSIDVTKALITDISSNFSTLEDEVKDHIINNEIPKMCQYLCFGGVDFASLKDLGNTRLKSVHEIINSIAPNANYAFQAVMSASAGNGVTALKLLTEDDHFFHSLSEESFLLNLNLKAAFIKLLPLIDFIETISRMPVSENLIENPKDSVPHLLHASL